MPNAGNECAHGKYTIDINLDTTSQVDIVYILVYLNLLRPITPVGYNRTKYIAFLIDNLSRC